MTPERWRQIDDLFDASLRLGPDERDAWLRRGVRRGRRASGRGFAPPCPGCERRPGRFHAASGGSERASWLDGELASPRRGPPSARSPTVRARQDDFGRRSRQIRTEGGDLS